MDTLKFYFVTWNVATKSPSQDMNALLDFPSQFNKNKPLPDFFVIGCVVPNNVRKKEGRATNSTFDLRQRPAAPAAPHETATTVKPQETKDNNTKTNPIDNKTGNKEPEKKDEVKPTEKSAPASKNDVKPEPTKETKPATAKNETTTVHPVPAKTTEKPKDVTEKPIVQSRGFPKGRTMMDKWIVALNQINFEPIKWTKVC